MHYVGERVRAARLEKGWSQARLAKASGRTKLTILRLERGRSEPQLATLEAVAAALGMTLADLTAPPQVERGRRTSGGRR